MTEIMFWQIEEGQVFKYKDQIFIRTDMETYHAVSLRTGQMKYMDCEDDVEVLSDDCSLVKILRSS